MTTLLNSLYNNRYVRIFITCVLGFMALVSVAKGIQNAAVYSQDFQWDAAKALCLGIDPYDQFENPQDVLSEGVLGDFYRYYEGIDAPQKMEANQFPSLLYLLLPYTFMSPMVARYAWLLSNLVFTALIIFLLRKTFLKDMGGFEFCIIMLLMLAGTPYRNQLGVGQHTLFAFMFFLLAVYFNEEDHRVLSTVCLFVSYFKYTLTAPLVIYFIYKKRYREIIISAGMHGVLTILAGIMLRESVLDMLIKPLKVASNLSAEGGIDFGALLGGSVIAYVLALVIAVLLIVISVKAPEGMENYIFGAALLWSLILTYHRSYDFFVLSAAACIFTATEKSLFKSATEERLCRCAFGILIIATYFVLRIFSENLFSRVCTGIIYYAFTVMITVWLVRNTFDKSANLIK